MLVGAGVFVGPCVFVGPGVRVGPGVLVGSGVGGCEPNILSEMVHCPHPGKSIFSVSVYMPQIGEYGCPSKSVRQSVAAPSPAAGCVESSSLSVGEL